MSERTYKLGRGNITIDESAKEDFKKLMKWSESDWNRNTAEIKKESSQEDEQILKEFREQGRKSKLTLMRLVRQSERKKIEHSDRICSVCCKKLNALEKIDVCDNCLKNSKIVTDERKKIEVQLKEARECIRENMQFNEKTQLYEVYCSDLIHCENTACPLNEGLK